MELLAHHLILATADTEELCRTHILDFFKQTSLLRYDRIEVIDESVLCGTDNTFASSLENGLLKNKKILAGLVDELGSAGCTKLDDLLSLPQGYPSKILHIIAHFLDGFIGIDTPFYNLVDDSHWLTDETETRIQTAPEHFWLYTLDCYSVSPKEAALLHM